MLQNHIKAEIWTPHSLLKLALQVIKSLKRDNINKYKFCFFNNHAKLNLPSMFQSSDIEPPSPKIET